VHEHSVEAGRVELSQVQADELRVRVVGGVLWLAGALEVRRSRLRLGGVVSVRWDRELVRSLLSRVRACGSVAAVLLCTDALASYPKEALRLFREALRTGRAGRPRLVLPEGVMVARAIKRYAKRRVKEVVRRVARDTREAVRARVVWTQRCCDAVINTAYIERLNATFRARLAPLARRTRAGVHRQGTLEAGMWLVGAVATTSAGNIEAYGWRMRQARCKKKKKKKKSARPHRQRALPTTAGRCRSCWACCAHLRPTCPSGGGGARDGWWRLCVQRDHGSMWCYP